MSGTNPAKIFAEAAREQKRQEAEYQDRTFVERVREALIEIIKESDSLRMPELEQQEDDAGPLPSSAMKAQIWLEEAINQLRSERNPDARTTEGC